MLFMLHDGAGDIDYAWRLMAHLPRTLAIYPLPPSLASADAGQSLVHLGSRYVRRIRSIQSNGPYRLAGWSFGGALAVEVALQLVAQGEEVAFLSALDAPLPCPSTGPLVPWQAGWSSGGGITSYDLLLGDLQDGPLGKLPRTHTALWRASRRGASLDDLLFELQELEALPARYAGHAVSVISRRLALRSALLQAYLAWNPADWPAGLPVHLVLASDAPDAARLLANWQTRVPAPLLQVTATPGTHLSMITQPHLLQLAAHLRSMLMPEGAAGEAAATASPPGAPAVQFIVAKETTRPTGLPTGAQPGPVKPG